MPFAVKCSCGKLYQVSENLIGKTVRCKSCGGAFVVPTPAAPQPGTIPATVNPQAQSQVPQQPLGAPDPLGTMPPNYPARNTPASPMGFPPQSPNPQQVVMGQPQPVPYAQQNQMMAPPYSGATQKPAGQKGLTPKAYWIIGGSSLAVIGIVVVLVIAFSIEGSGDKPDNNNVAQNKSQNSKNRNSTPPKRTNITSDQTNNKANPKTATFGTSGNSKRNPTRTTQSKPRHKNVVKEPNVKPKSKPIENLTWEAKPNEWSGVGLGAEQSIGKLEVPFNAFGLAVSKDGRVVVRWGDARKIGYVQKGVGKAIILDTKRANKCCLSDNGNYVAALSSEECTVFSTLTKKQICTIPFYRTTERMAIGMAIEGTDRIHIANENGWLVANLKTGATIRKIELQAGLDPNSIVVHDSFKGITILDRSGKFYIVDEQNKVVTKDWGVAGKLYQTLCSDGTHMIEMSKDEESRRTINRLNIQTGKRTEIVEFRKEAYNLPTPNSDGSLVIVNTGDIKNPDKSKQKVIVDTTTTPPKVVAKLVASPLRANNYYLFMPTGKTLLTVNVASNRFSLLELH